MAAEFGFQWRNHPTRYSKHSLWIAVVNTFQMIRSHLGFISKCAGLEGALLVGFADGLSNLKGDRDIETGDSRYYALGYVLV